MQIPEVHLELEAGTLGGMYTTVEGLLSQIIDNMSENSPVFMGDSAIEEKKKQYDGDWKEDKQEGYGILFNKDGNKVYEGNWKNNTPDGTGTLFYDNGKERYNGEWKNGKWNGKDKVMRIENLKVLIYLTMQKL